LYQRAALFVMPSYYESFGISVVEAMAFGLPVVGARAGGITETIEDEVNGVLVNPGDSPQLAETILQLFADNQRRRRLGQAGQAKDFGEFGPAKIARQNLEVYEQARESFRSGLHR